MPSLQIISPLSGEHFTLTRDPMSSQVMLPCVTLRISEPDLQMKGDALVVRSTQNPLSSIFRPLFPAEAPGEYRLTSVMVVGPPSPGGVYESFKICAWAKIAGNIFSATPVPIQIKVI
jgi:hypothetical protein